MKSYQWRQVASTTPKSCTTFSNFTADALAAAIGMPDPNATRNPKAGFQPRPSVPVGDQAAEDVLEQFRGDVPTLGPAASAAIEHYENIVRKGCWRQKALPITCQDCSVDFPVR